MAFNSLNNFIGNYVVQAAENTEFAYKYTQQLSEISSVELASKLANVNKAVYPPSTIANPVYTKSTDTFGVLNHIDTIHGLFTDAQRGIEDLRFELKDSNNENHLIGKAKKYINSLYSANNADTDILDQFFSKFRQGGQFKIRVLDTLIELPLTDSPPIPVAESTTNTISAPHNAQSALFGTGKIMRNDIRYTEELRRAISQYRKYQQRQLIQTKEKLEAVRSDIPKEHKNLAVLNRQRLESLSDYQVVRQLVAENWAEVAENYSTRERILNNNQGIYFSRVRETPVSKPPSRPLSLRFSSPNDLVPGYPLEDKDLPDELEAFMETILDIPMSDWLSLHSHFRLLPTRRRLKHLVTWRKTRLEYRLKANAGYINNATTLRMSRLNAQNRALLHETVKRNIFSRSHSLLDYQRQTSELLSLEDLLAGSPHRLRGLAESLRNKLDQAAHSLLEQLRTVAPSIRLDWAEAAEADTLTIDRPNTWPGLDKAKDKDFNAVRTIIELVQWWFRQLTPNTQAASFSAVRNIIRATIILSISDDPEDILHGKLQTIPQSFSLGHTLRVVLNREAQIGTLLQLIDNNHRFVGTLRVDDYDDEGAITTITKIQNTTSALSTTYTVSGYAIPGLQR